VDDVLAVASLAEAPAGVGISAPGQLASHYAPSKPLRFNAAEAAEGEWLIGFDGISGDENLSPTGALQKPLQTCLRRCTGRRPQPRRALLSRRYPKRESAAPSTTGCGAGRRHASARKKETTLPPPPFPIAIGLTRRSVSAAARQRRP
jgi:hypothetical protein